MKLKNEKEWEKGKANNTDPYGAGVYSFAERWADLMEKGIAAGIQLKDIAEKAEREADTEGITGYMYGCAVNILSYCWEHGEELRKWHNGNYGYDGEGVVNPAILTIKD